MKHPYIWKTTVILLQVMCLLGIFGICYAAYYKAGNSIINMAQIDGGKYENTEFYLDEVDHQIQSLGFMVEQEKLFQKDWNGKMSTIVDMRDYGHANIQYEVDTLLKVVEHWSSYQIIFCYGSEADIADETRILLPAEARRILLVENAAGLSEDYLEDLQEEAEEAGTNYNWILYHDGNRVGGMSETEATERYQNEITVEFDFSVLNEQQSKLHTKDGKSLLEYCRTIPICEYNDMYNMVTDEINRIWNSYVNYQESLYHVPSSIRIMIAGEDNECLYDNSEEEFIADLYTSGDKWLKSVKTGENNFIYFNTKNFRMETSLNVDTNKLYTWYMSLSSVFDKDFAAAIVIPAGDIANYEIQDALYEGKILYDQIRPLLKYYVSILFGCLLGAIILLIALTSMCGRSRKEGITLIWFDRIPTEIAAFIMGVAGLFGLAMTVEVIDESVQHVGNLIYIGMDMGMIVGIHLLFLFGYTSLVRRMRAGVLWKNSISRMLWAGMVFCLRHIHDVIKTLAGYVVFVLFNLVIGELLLKEGSFEAFVLLVFVDMLVGGYMLYQAYIRSNIQKAVKRISDGDITYQMDNSYIHGDYRKLVDDLNRIGEGLQGAVDANMKNERLKTDLITNVSHDIKTPLTSIINYIGLIKREDVENERIKEYVNVLDQKAQRLKSLTEDLVEVSRITSGNIVLQMMPLDFVEIVQQTAGEFDEKFENRNLQLIMNFPPENITIHADGRRLYRVIENLFNNVAKYAMPATRVYVDILLENGGSNAILSVKNISEKPLNIQATELTERFIRGDDSRSTEGSGLGLSIAKSLTEAQGGMFEIYLDGDLFRATLTFPRIRREFVMEENEKIQQE